MKIKQHLNLLGLRVKERVTGMEGVATSISFDLYGCIQAVLNPGIDKDGKPKDQHYFDVSRLEILDNKPVMERPNFDFGDVADGKHGPAEKPQFKK